MVIHVVRHQLTIWLISYLSEHCVQFQMKHYLLHYHVFVLLIVAHSSSHDDRVGCLSGEIQLAECYTITGK